MKQAILSALLILGIFAMTPFLALAIILLFAGLLDLLAGDVDAFLLSLGAFTAAVAGALPGLAAALAGWLLPRYERRRDLARRGFAPIIRR